MTDSALVNAQQRLSWAQARNREAESADYCCAAAQSQAVGKTRKEVKRWEQWIADQAVLTGFSGGGDDDDEIESVARAGPF